MKPILFPVAMVTAHGMLLSCAVPFAAAVPANEGAAPASRTAQTPPDDGRPLHILLITGGGWHDFPTQKTILTEGIGKRIKAVFTVDDEAGADPTAVPSRFRDPDWASGYDLVLYNMSLSREQKPETAQAIVESHRRHRIPAVFIHGSVHSSI